MARKPPRRRQARPPLGQHFLKDPGVRARILNLLDCRPEDCWLEIGAGHGEMTLALARSGRALAAVERDAELASALRGRLSGLADTRVVEGNILQISVAEVARELGCERLRVYGNLPYYITSPILQHLFASIAVIADVHVMVQREVADRIVAVPGGREYGYLSVLTQWYAAPEVLLPISAGAFQPPPQVESALVRLAPPGLSARLKVDEPEGFLRFVAACFRQKRKTLRNNLRGTYGARAVEALTQVGLSPRSRAEELSAAEFAQLYRFLAGGDHA